MTVVVVCAFAHPFIADSWTIGKDHHACGSCEPMSWVERSNTLSGTRAALWASVCARWSWSTSVPGHVTSPRGEPGVP